MENVFGLLLDFRTLVVRESRVSSGPTNNDGRSGADVVGLYKSSFYSKELC